MPTPCRCRPFHLSLLFAIATTALIVFAITMTSSSSSSSITGSTHALAASAAAPSRKVVVVSGAGGQTGQSLFRQMLDLPAEDNYWPIGLVRTEQSKQALVQTGNIPPDQVVVCDVTDPSAIQSMIQNLKDPVVAFCIATSAKPSPTGETDSETGRPVFGFPNGPPEVVDWDGQKNQIDACPDGCHVVLCSTMGGTDPDHPLNKLGRTTAKTNEGKTIEVGGNIVRWKRKAEMYLMDQSPRLSYTIVHPGGLLNEPGGQRELVVGVDDDTTAGGTDSRTVPRPDVARVMLEAVKHPEVYAGRSFDLRAKTVEETDTPTTDFVHLLDSLEGKNCDYTLGAIM